MVLTLAQGVSDLPIFLRGGVLPTSHNIGTQRYCWPPAAVIIGCGHDNAAVLEMRNACKGISHVPWLHHDRSVPASYLPPGPQYAAEVVERMSARLTDIREDGRIEADGLYGYQTLGDNIRMGDRDCKS